MKRIKFLCAAVLALTALTIGQTRHATAATIAIDDLTDTISATSSFGSIVLGTETVTFRGSFVSTDTSRPKVGSTRTFNVNLVSDGFFLTPKNCAAELTTVTCLSDTMTATLTGISSAGSADNVAVSLSFTSDPAAFLSPADFTAIEDGTFQHFSPLSDLDISLRSDCGENLVICAQGVPEPASLAMLGFGLAALGAARRRKR